MKAALGFGVAMYDKRMATAPGEISPINEIVPSAIEIMNTDPPYFHSDGDDMVPHMQLEAVTYPRVCKTHNRHRETFYRRPASTQDSGIS